MSFGSVTDCTVVVLAYNLEDYILDCLNSIEAQETTHNLKVLVHDDCSTDRTLAVIREFASRSKLDFNIVVPDENRYTKGMGFFYDLLLSTETKYVAILDGDDVWSDKSKLQIQIDQLETNPNLAISTHVFSIVTNDLQTELGTWPNNEFRIPIGRSSDLARENYIGALTVVFRRSLLPEAISGYDALGTNDYPIWGLLSSFGDIGFVDRKMAKYRQHQSQMYANRTDESRGRIALECKIFVASNMLRGEVRDMWIDSIQADILGNKPTLIEQLSIENFSIKQELEALKHRIEILDHELHNRSHVIETIYDSFSWRITLPIRRIAKLLKNLRNR